ncbi:MAG: hypothetical protein H7287_06780 [Thermoleophilia bacterium]|nr:hypothetical protein [Thermoleophilia bacterium]
MTYLTPHAIAFTSPRHDMRAVMQRRVAELAVAQGIEHDLTQHDDAAQARPVTQWAQHELERAGHAVVADAARHDTYADHDASWSRLLQTSHALDLLLGLRLAG